MLRHESPGIVYSVEECFRCINKVEQTAEQRVVCKQCHGVWFAVGALKLVEHFSDGQACISSGESGHI
jgi:hypothetical protein